MLTSTATVATATPERYAKQLASHLGRKTEVLTEGSGQRIVLTAGSCLLESVDGALVLHANADAADGLQRAEALASHDPVECGRDNGTEERQEGHARRG